MLTSPPHIRPPPHLLLCRSPELLLFSARPASHSSLEPRCGVKAASCTTIISPSLHSSFRTVPQLDVVMVVEVEEVTAVMREEIRQRDLMVLMVLQFVIMAAHISHGCFPSHLVLAWRPGVRE